MCITRSQWSLIIYLLALAGLSGSLQATVLSCEYDLQHSHVSAPSSDTTLSGVVHGVRIHCDFLRLGLCCTNSFYFGQGRLNGEDAYDDELASDYSEVEGEVRCGLPVEYGCWHLTPYIGLGARIHQFENRTFLDTALDFEYLYVPIGICATRMLSSVVLLEAEVQYDAQAYGKWKFEHDALGTKRSSMIKSFGLHFRLLGSYQLCRCVWLNLQGTTRITHLKFRNHGQVAFHSRKQCNFGVQTGIAYHF